MKTIERYVRRGHFLVFYKRQNKNSESALASHADVLRLVSRDKPKNFCVGG